jgi:hypothetical protein
MRINGMEIEGYESIVANLDVINDEIRPINCKENFSCDKGVWYQFYFDNLLVTVIMMHRSTCGGTAGLFEIGIRDKDTNEWLVDNPYINSSGHGVEGWKTYNEIQRILKRMLVDTMRKIREENK